MKLLYHDLLLTLAAGLLMAAGCATSGPSTPADGSPQPGIPDDLSSPLPVDAAVRRGVLDNGLRYVIRENGHPEQRAELRLVVNAGSVLEDEDQLGLAHFLEHMAFNGTAAYPKRELTDYLESMGMRMGADLNAYTSFDETVYMLQLSTDSFEVVDKGVQILQEWASRMLLDPEEIDKERGVIVEEWRLGRGAAARMRDKQLPILLKDSRYTRRLPIGSREVLETFDHEALRRFYRDWYRPDLMAIVAVGDFDTDAMEAAIMRHASKIPGRDNPRERTLYPVPDHTETLFTIVADPEATRTSLSLNYKHAVGEDGTLQAYRRNLIAGLYNRMLNDRLRELTRQEDPPFLGAYSSQGRFVRTKEFYLLGAAVKESGIERGLGALVTEALRVDRHGFTQSELDRTKRESLRWMEQLYRERDKVPSSRLAAEYVRHVLVNEPIPGLVFEYQLYQKLIPGIELQEVNRLASEWIRDENLVVEVGMPEKEGVAVPGSAQLLQVMEDARKREIEPYVEEVSDDPLVETPPDPGSIVSEVQVPEVGVTEWHLSNGVRVVIKPTDFKNDQILFSAFSPGGHSLVDDADFVPALTSATVVGQGGLGEFDAIELGKKLAGRVVRVSPWIGELEEGLRGNASPEDVQTLFELIYLTFTAPRQDSSAYISYRSRVRGVLENRDASPGRVFQDTLQLTMSQHHYRTRPWSMEMVDEMDLSRSMAIYRDRFADASDFTFVFVGNVDPEVFRPLVETYIGGLPALGREETWRDVGVRPPKGVIEKVVRKGEEPKSQTSIIFTSPFEWSETARHHLFSMSQVLNLKLGEVMREDMSGTYSVGVSSSASRDPISDCTVSFRFGCSPERAEELAAVVMAQVDSVRQFGIAESYVRKVQESMRLERQTSLKQNGYWLGALGHVLEYGLDFAEILKFDEKIDALTPAAIQEAAQKYLPPDNYVRVVLLPADDEE